MLSFDFQDQSKYTSLSSDPFFDLSDVLPRFFPDENDNIKIFSWEKVDGMKNIEWEKNLREIDNINETIVAKDGIIYPGNGNFSIMLSGKKGTDGFSKVSITLGDVYGECEASLQPEYFLQNKIYESTQIKIENCIRQGLGKSIHEIYYPGKKPVWINLNFSSGTKMGLLFIDVYFNKDQALANW